MKFKFPLIAAFVAMLSLTACGGGGSSNSSSTPTTVASPATFSFTDTTTGTGASAVPGKNVTVKYTGWLYSTTAANNKGTQFDSGTYTFVVGTGAAIQGFDLGVQGMKVGGKRTVLIPYSMGYGSAGTAGIPGGSGLVFDIELVSVQ